MRVTTAFFAGIGTVVVAIAAGLGGGLLLGDIMSPQQPKHPGSEMTRLEQRMSPQPIPATNGASQPVPYMAATQAAAMAEPQAQPPPTQAQPAAIEPSAAREGAAPEDANARARDAEPKRDARRVEDRRKAERRQQSAERKKWRQRQDDDIDNVEASVREATELRPLFARGPGFGAGRFTWFDD